MATIQEMKDVVSTLSNDGVSILPSKEEIVENYVSSKCKDAIEMAENKEEYKKKMIDYYITGPGKEAIDNMINDFNESYSALMDGIEDMKTSIANTTASNAIPSTLVTGSAAGVANPAYVAIDNAQKKHVLSMNLKNLKSHAKKLLTSAIGLNFEVPDSVVDSISLVSSLSQGVDSIPG